MCVSHLRLLLRDRVKEKKGLLVAYHVLHDDGAAVMNYERFAEFVKHLPRVNVRAAPHDHVNGDADRCGVPLVVELAHALCVDLGLPPVSRFADRPSPSLVPRQSSKAYHTRFMFRELDRSRNGTISVREFLQLKSVMSLKCVA